jgi:hypothetical protein
MKDVTARSLGPASLLLVLASVALVALAVTMSAAGARSACGICGKNLVKNPGAELGMGVMSVGAFGKVPGWENVAGQFGAASYKFPNGWFSTLSKGSPKRGRNYFFGGTTTEATTAPASIGKQTIALPAAAVGRKATLSGWLGNYGTNRSQVRAEFMDAAGTVLSSVRIGPAVTIAGTDMSRRSRSGTVPAKTTQVTVVMTFSAGNNYKLAGVDDVSLVLS